MSTKRRTPGVHSSPTPKDEAGQKLCRNCGNVLPKGRRFNCSTACSEEWRGKTSPSYMRHLVHKRDKGVCASCGKDMDALKKQYESINRDAMDYRMGMTVRQIFLRDHGIPASRVTGDWWDADHIVPVVEGGGECGLANFRTLCIACHKKATAELRGRMAAQDRAKKAEERDRSGLFADQL